jgi:hypothetical protein
MTRGNKKSQRRAASVPKSTLPQPQRSRTRRRGLIRALVDAFCYDIRDQEMRIDRAVVDDVMQLRPLGPRIAP